MKRNASALFAFALVLSTFVAACSGDEETSNAGKGGTAGSGGSATGGTSGAGGSGTGGATGGTAGSGGSATGGTAGSGGGAGIGTGGTAGIAGTAGTAGAAGTGGSAGQPSSDADCAAMTRPQCRQCCGTLHTAGAHAYDQAYTACVCTADTCSSQCQQSVCATPANPGPTPSCNTCLGEVTAQGAACDPATIAAACTDAGCAAYLSCVNGCTG